MRNWCDDDIEEAYERWLEENCECDPSPIHYDDFQPCRCMSFDDWFDNLKESAIEGMDEQDLDEQYA